MNSEIYSPYGYFTSRFYANTNRNSRRPYKGYLNPRLAYEISNRNDYFVRQRVLAARISAPRPVNLPSLKRESASGAEASTSPKPQHGWGSTNSSPSSAQVTLPEDKNSATQDSTLNSTKERSDPGASPKLSSSSSKKDTSGAWETLSETKVQIPTTGFPTVSEASTSKSNKHPMTDNKEHEKYASPNTNHTPWDEMVNEDLNQDFTIDVMEFDDGARFQVKGDNPPVLPSERFADDYDRSYDNHCSSTNRYDQNDRVNNEYKPYRRSVDYGYNSRYNGNSQAYESRHFNSTGGERRSSTSDRWPRRESFDNHNRRANYNRNHQEGNHRTYQQTRYSSSQSFKSENAHEETPIQVVTSGFTEQDVLSQKSVMLTALERAKRRLDEEEAEYKAAAERAKRKADALAHHIRDTKTLIDDDVSSSCVPAISKPWNVVAANQESPKTSYVPIKILTHTSEIPLTKAKEETILESKQVCSPEAEKKPAIDAKDESKEDVSKEKCENPDLKRWNDFILTRGKTEEGHCFSSNDWQSFATRSYNRETRKHQQSSANERKPESCDFKDKRNGRGRTRTNSFKSSEYSRSYDASSKKQETHGFTEILRHETKQEKIQSEELVDEPKQEGHEPEILTNKPKQDSPESLSNETLSYKEMLALLLKQDVSPRFPSYIPEPPKKPSNLNFMMNACESVEDVDTMNFSRELSDDEFSVENSTSTSTVRSSTDSNLESPSLHTESLFPTLLYQNESFGNSKDLHSKQSPKVYFKVLKKPNGSYTITCN